MAPHLTPEELEKIQKLTHAGHTPNEIETDTEAETEAEAETDADRPFC